jgi:5-formyltetrahydrofolate cyclo-ligase
MFRRSLIMMTTPELRREIHRRIAAMTEEQREKETAILCDKLLRLSEPYRRIYAFAPTKSEPDLYPLYRTLWAQHKQLYFPLCHEDGVMTYGLVRDENDMEVGMFGLKGPGKSVLRATPNAIDLMLVPCAAVTRSGVRVGHGGGYYDRYLASHHCHTVCPVFTCQVVDEIHRESHDIVMHQVVVAEEVK